MNLNQVKLNTNCIVKDVLIPEQKTKIRLMELGLIKGVNVIVKNRSMLKKTLLIIFNSSCFSLNADIAKYIEVNYV